MKCSINLPKRETKPRAKVFISLHQCLHRQRAVRSTRKKLNQAKPIKGR